MKVNRVTRSVALVSGAGLAVVPIAFAATPSFAAADCGEGTEVASGICEKAFTTAGDYTFAVPASVSKMSAVLVGGGQGGTSFEAFLPYSGGGGGGGVLFVDSVDMSETISLTVGAGGEGGNVEENIGGDTTVGTNTAGGGGNAAGRLSSWTLWLESGSPQRSPGFDIRDTTRTSGGGAGGSPTTCLGGLGLTASSVAAGSSLFPAILGEPVYGAGGGTCSGDKPIANGAGQGGSATQEPSLSFDAGVAGAVILRWAPSALPDDALPDTGVNMHPWVIGASVAAVLGGAILAAGAVRLRRE
jgi:hypothetical protein